MFAGPRDGLATRPGWGLARLRPETAGVCGRLPQPWLNDARKRALMHRSEVADQTGFFLLIYLLFFKLRSVFLE